jgi:UDP-N-acetylglucosamine:LPS N-acetylglucosamine transferase
VEAIVMVGAKDRRWRAPAAEPEDHPDRILILSASLGAGHDGAAREWARRLRQQGFEVDIHDFLALLPAGLGRGVRYMYKVMLERVPWAYSLTFRLTAMARGKSVVRTILAACRSRLWRILPPGTVAVLSTYPLASQMLGQLRSRGRLAIPAFTYLTDFSVHPIWVAQGIDAHYALHEVTAEWARALGAANVVVTSPLVSDRFTAALALTKRDARAQFGLPKDERLVLLVAGSWGVGDVKRTAAEIARTGVAIPVVVCGRNDALRRQLKDAGIGCPLGWVSNMPELMRAVDVLVENAGGLTSLEAMASGLPIATYRPLPGHGRANAVTLMEAKVSTWIRDPAALGPVLAELIDGPQGQRQRMAGLALFASDRVDSAVDVLATATELRR